MIIGVLMLGLLAAIGATAISLILGHGLLVALAVYVTVGLMGTMAGLTLCLVRQSEDTDALLAPRRA